MAQNQLTIKECKEIAESEGIKIVRTGGWYDIYFPKRIVRNLDPSVVRKYFYKKKTFGIEKADIFLRIHILNGKNITEEAIE